MRPVLTWRSYSSEHSSKPQPISSHLGSLLSFGAGGGVFLTFFGHIFCILGICHAFRQFSVLFSFKVAAWEGSAGELNMGFYCWH